MKKILVFVTCSLIFSCKNVSDISLCEKVLDKNLPFKTLPCETKEIEIGYSFYPNNLKLELHMKKCLSSAEGLLYPEFSKIDTLYEKDGSSLNVLVNNSNASLIDAYLNCDLKYESEDVLLEGVINQKTCVYIGNCFISYFYSFPKLNANRQPKKEEISFLADRLKLIMQLDMERESDFFSMFKTIDMESEDDVFKYCFILRDKK